MSEYSYISHIFFYKKLRFLSATTVLRRLPFERWVLYVPHMPVSHAVGEKLLPALNCLELAIIQFPQVVREICSEAPSSKSPCSVPSAKEMIRTNGTIGIRSTAYIEHHSVDCNIYGLCRIFTVELREFVLIEPELFG